MLNRMAGRVSAWLDRSSGPRDARVYYVRLVVQGIFALTCLVLALQLVRFYRAAEAGATTLPTRPPGVEGFLPIGGLMGLIDWAYQGTLNTIHPAATLLIVIFLIISWVLRKAFCGWICPVGLLRVRATISPVFVT